MAITIDLSNITINLETKIGTVTDASVYTSPTRAVTGVFLKVYKSDYKGSLNTQTTTGNTVNPDTDVSWVFPFDKDGWYQLFYVAVPDWAVATYAKYDVVFNPVAGIVYRSKIVSNSVTVVGDLLVTANWEVISDPTQLCFNIGTTTASVNLNTNTSISIENVILYPNTKVNFGNQTAIAFLEATSNYKRAEDVRLYELLGLAVDGMFIANERQQYALGELFARRAASLCSTC